MTKKIYLAIYSVLLLFFGFYSCKSHQSKVTDDIVARGELVLTLSNDVPGYFTLEDKCYGYQYDLFKAYADELGVKLRINVENSDAMCRKMLRRGETDIVATTAANSSGYEKSLEIYKTKYVVLANKNKRSPFASNDLFEKIIRGDEADYQNAKILISSGFKNTKAYSDMLESSASQYMFLSARSSLELIDQLSSGKYSYVICEKSEAQLGCALIRNVKQVYEFKDEVAMHIATNSSDADFFDDFGRWFANYRNSPEYAMLNDLYFEKGIVGQLIGKNSYEHTPGSISAYDDIMRKVSQEQGMDWRFLSAIAYSESRFNKYAVSPKGARGIMQIMPIVARQFNIAESEVMKPEINIMLAAKLLVKIERMLKIPADTPFEDKMSIILACYNGGVGHVVDARNLAEKYGRNPNSWEDVSSYLRLKSNETFHQDSVVRHGKFSGSGETLAFVDRVMGRYDRYCIIAKR